MKPLSEEAGYRITAQIRVCADVPVPRHSEPQQANARIDLRQEIFKILEEHLSKKYLFDVSEYVVVDVDKI